MKKTLIFNFDGTDNDPNDASQQVTRTGVIEDESITNILKFHLLIGGTLTKENYPLANGSRSFYYPGIGTYGHYFQRKYNAGLAKESLDVRRILKQALADFARYYHGDSGFDTILVTGFSRGAALARRFAALINNQVSSPCIIEGVFDTVASLNWPNLSMQVLPSTEVVFEHGCELPSNVMRALHLVALDEKRKVFQPTLMNHKSGVVEEVWFSGAHADVGGGYYYDGLSDNCLRYFLTWFDDLQLGIPVLSANNIDFKLLTDESHYVIGKDDLQVDPDLMGLNHQQDRHWLLKWTLADRRCKVLQNDSVSQSLLPVVHHSVAFRVNSNRQYRPQSLRNVTHLLQYDDNQLKQFSGYSDYKLHYKRQFNLPTPLGIETVVFAHKKYNHTNILLKKGKTYCIKVEPGCFWNDGGIKHVDANGWNREDISLGIKELPIAAMEPYRRVTSANAKWFSLCGCIDADDSNAFVIGTCLSEYTASCSGELCCFANDLDGYYGNNTGKLKLRVYLIDEQCNQSNYSI